jgi:predicted dithiol-disulfide oxidoreductase (DUF899 family)
MELHTKHFPNESASYREARNNVLAAEIALRRQTEAVAQMRRDMPRGGALKENYVFESTADGSRVAFSDLFAPDKDTLIIYSMMYHPDDESACPSCTSILDGLDGSSPHVNDRVNFVAATKAPWQKARQWADGRGWRNLNLYSSFNNNYNADYFAENEKGNQQPILNVFHKNADGIYHTYATEIMWTKSEPGQDPRHVDSIWPIWNLFDMTPDGRGTKWNPKFSYAPDVSEIALPK